MMKPGEVSLSGQAWVEGWAFRGTTSQKPDRLAALSQLACGVFLLTQVLGGVVRWLLDMAGAPVAAYLPNIFMVAIVAFVVLADLLNQRTSRGLILFTFALLLSAVVGYINTGKAVQVVFGGWVLTPFFFGLTCAPSLLRRDRFTRLMLVILFTLCVLGLVLESFVSLPWVGLSYSVGGVDIEGAREWQTSGGAPRLSGFARSSFDVAGQILFYTALLVLQLRHGFARSAVWAVALGAVSLSTSKGSLLSLAMTALAVESVIHQKPRLLYGLLALGILWIFIPPLMSWTMDWSANARTDLNHPIYGSFIDRMNDMWPRAWTLAFDRGLPPLGRGLGGIGVPLSIFEPELENARDNLFLYCMVLLGVWSVPMFALGFAGLFKLCSKLRFEAPRQALVVAVAINWYGGVSNIMEHAVLALGFGMVCRAVVAQLSGSSFGECAPHHQEPEPPLLPVCQTL